MQLYAATFLLLKPRVAVAIFPFVNKRYHFRNTEMFLTLNKFFSTKGSNHLASNLELLFPNIPLIPLHYQVRRPRLRKI